MTQQIEEAVANLEIVSVIVMGCPLRHTYLMSCNQEPIPEKLLEKLTEFLEGYDYKLHPILDQNGETNGFRVYAVKPTKQPWWEKLLGREFNPLVQEINYFILQARLQALFMQKIKVTGRVSLGDS